MIIDSHTHILPDEFNAGRSNFCERDRTFRALFDSPKAKLANAAALIAEMDANQVDVSIALGYGWSDHTTAQRSNDYILESATNYPGRIVPFCSVNPLWGEQAITEIERCHSAGAVGIGELHPDTQGLLNVEMAQLKPFMQRAQELNMPIMIHASEPVGHSYPGKGTVTPDALMVLVTAFPANRFIFPHFGGGLPFYALMPEVATALQNVWFDSAAFPFLYRPDVFPVTATAAGARKILFGSDYPLIKQSRALKEFNQTTLPPETSRMILSENARQLFAI